MRRKDTVPGEKPAEKAPDIRNVAAQAGVSISTVSRFMNGKSVRKDAEARIAAAVKELGYRPNRIARSLKSSRTMTLGMVLPDITNAFFPEVVKGAELAAREAGFHLVLANTGENPEDEWDRLENLRALRCDGILITPSVSLASEESRRRFAGTGLPMVFVDRRPGWQADVVVSDNVRSAEEAVSHLLRLGHRRIALLNSNLVVSTHAERAQGYRQALRRAGLESEPGLSASIVPTVADGFSAMVRLLQSPTRPSALFVTSNRLTVGAMAAIHGLGLTCPDDIAVVGYDDYPWQDAFRPRLTTVSQPAFLMGQRAVELLLARIDGRHTGPAEEIVLPSQLVVRESCGVYATRRPPPP